MLMVDPVDRVPEAVIEPPDRLRFAAVLGLTLAGALLRLPGLGAKAYWQDEVATVNVLDSRFADLVGVVSDSQNTPPLYYLLAWPWARVFGTSEVGLRSLSTILSVALIPVAYLMGRRLLSGRVGLLSAALVAVNPMLVWYAQDAKAYALLALLAGVSFLLFLRALDHPSAGRLIAWGASCGLAVATHYFAVFVVAVEAIWLLWKIHPRRLAVVGATVPVLTGLALLPLVHAQGTPGWVAGMTLRGRLIQVPPFFIVGFEAPAPYALTAVAAAICGVGLWLLVFRSTERGRRRGLLAVGISIASVVVALVGADYFLYRNVIASLPPLLVGLACGFGAARAGRLGLGAGAALCALSVGIVVATAHTPKFGKEDWREAASVVGGVGEASRLIVVTPENGRDPLAYYLGGQTRRSDESGALVGEIVVVGGAVRRPGSTTAARPPRGPARAAPGGFRVVRRVDARYFTVVTYQAAAPKAVSAATARALALGQEPRLLISSRLRLIMLEP